MPVFNDVGSPKAISASTLVKTGGGSLLGIFITSAGAGGTSKCSISDGLVSALSTASGLFVKPFKVVSGQFYRIPASFGTGLFVSRIGSAWTGTVIYSPAT